MNNLAAPWDRAPSIWRRNPALTHLLGLSPLLAVSHTLIHGLVLGVAAAFTFLAAAVAVQRLGRVLRGRWRYVGYLLLLAALTSVNSAIIMALLPGLARDLGVYLPLLCCNFAILVRLDDCRERDLGEVTTAILRLAAGYCLALILFSALRELLITGSLFTAADPQATPDTTAVRFGFAGEAPAAFLLLAALVAARQWLEARVLPERKAEHDSTHTVARARVTGQLKEGE